MNQGWISLHRKILEWEWYDDANTMRVFIHCLLRANHEDGQWHGKDIKRGQFISSYGKIAQELKLGVQNVRTSINKLKLTGELTSKGTNKYTVFTVLKYDEYQETNKQNTNNQQTTNKQLTTNNNNNNNNNENNISTERKKFLLKIKKAFDVFWTEYPKKKSKRQAEQSFEKIFMELINRPDEAPNLLKRIITSVKEHIMTEQWQEFQYIPLPSTWLNQRRWEDEIDKDEFI